MDRNRKNKKYSNNWNNHKNFDNQNRRNQNSNHPVNKEKTFHWNNFWNLLRLNMEDWMPHA